MKKAIMALMVLGGFATAVLFAQNSGAAANPGNGTPPNPSNIAQRQIQRLTTLLDLTPDQVTQATTIFTNAASNSAGIFSNLRSERQALHTAVQNNDSNGISQDSTAIGTLTGQLTGIAASAQAAFYQILTPTQQTKLNSLRGGSGRMMGGPPMEPGGPGPRGFHPGN